MAHTFGKNAKQLVKNHHLLEKRLSQLFPTQKNMLYNILKVPQNLMRGKHRKLVIRCQKGTSEGIETKMVIWNRIVHQYQHHQHCHLHLGLSSCKQLPHTMEHVIPCFLQVYISWYHNHHGSCIGPCEGDHLEQATNWK